MFLQLLSVCYTYQTFANGDQTPIVKSTKKNIIMLVTDGTGPASINMARYFRQYRDDLDISDTLTLDKYFVGSSRTRSNSSLITDSAAGATVFSCGLKTYNGAIAVDPLQNPCGTILEALKLKGYKTGLVVTTSLTDATPAAFNSHADDRSMQSLIAGQQLGLDTSLGLVTDLMIGGGRCFYLPGSDPAGCRTDQLNMVERAKDLGFTVALDKNEFDQLDLGKNATLPLLSLLAYYNIPYDIDRDEAVYPSLEEEVITALTMLSEATKDSDEGFFLMIEGSRIDHAGHQNDPAAQVREVLAFDKAFKQVIDFVDSTDVETFVISTSDHETGGLTVGRQVTPTYPEYLWKPDALLNATKSGEYAIHKINTFKSELEKQGEDDLQIKGSKLYNFIKTDILEQDLGITDYTHEDIARIIADITKAHDYLNDMVSVRAEIGWSTHGHTAVDVNIYGHSNTERGLDLIHKYLRGNVENTEIGKFWEHITGSDLSHVTKLLEGTKHSISEEDISAENEQESVSHLLGMHPLPEQVIDLEDQA
ncbi:hypothetical protein CANARDRAFT_197876 [[Candida] arabinofermentans NRRL YB-2248]|uniref:Alkaline phosphatase n=1 Tax=[Candida] arabinofermentans NRRL YB-2248 TaxID=983967 RepID=A0A1E4T1S8_9ASCO|nr:hypothetical protein CANARDRAFT_197876 [[Candida] arabinofermentans NRRL YB-2248]